MDSPPARSPLSLGELLSELPVSARVMDLGCGGGSFDYAHCPHLRILAVDEAVHEKVKDFPPHVRFIQARAAAIPERDGSIDLIVANFAFEHFPDGPAALKEIDRVARSGARVWISLPNAGSFEDQLYRNLYAGGGHLQRPTFERFLRLAYEFTSLKLISYLELPAGFTYLGESEALRRLTWAIVDALRRTIAVDARSRSGYIFVLQKFASAGPGFREHFRCCHQCGSPDETAPADSAEANPPEHWICPACGVRNIYPSSLAQVSLDDVERSLQLQWERFPETRPERLKELVDERGRWGQELDREVRALRGEIARLNSTLNSPRHLLRHLLRALRLSRLRIPRESFHGGKGSAARPGNGAPP